MNPISRPDRSTYLADWVAARRASVFKSTDESYPAVLTEAEVAAEGLEQYVSLGTGLCRDLTRSPAFDSCPVEFRLLRWPGKTNAFAAWPAMCSVVFFTTDLIRDHSAMCLHTQQALPHVLNNPGFSDHFLVKGWGALPRDEESFDTFGGLLMHIGFTFLVYHEVAHIGLGHQWAHRTATATLQPKGDEDLIVDELAIAAMATSFENAAGNRVQATEADADIHAISFTLDYVSQLTTGLATVVGGAEPESVWRRVLEEPSTRRSITLLAAFVAMFSLLKEKPSYGNMHASSHPPIPARMLMLALTEEQRAGNKSPGFFVDALNIAIAAAGYRELNAALIAEATAAPTGKLITLDNAPTLEQLFARIGLDELPLQADAIRELYASHSATLRSIFSYMTRRFSEGQLVRWY